MSTLSTAARSAARNAINALADAGAGANPTLRFRTAADLDLLSVTLDGAKAIADAVSGVSEFNPPDGEASWVDYSQLPSAAGICAKVVLCDKDATVVETYSIGVVGSGEETEVLSLTFATDIPLKWSAAPTVTQRATYDPTP